MKTENLVKPCRVRIAHPTGYGMIILMNKLLKIFFVIIKVILCLFLTLAVGVWSSYILIIAFTHPINFDWQMIIFTIFSVLIIIGVWIIAFVKTNKIIILLYLILLITYFFTPKIFPSVMMQFNIDSCLDRGGCWDSIRNNCEMNNQKKCTETISK